MNQGERETRERKDVPHPVGRAVVNRTLALQSGPRRGIVKKDAKHTCETRGIARRGAGRSRSTMVDLRSVGGGVGAIAARDWGQAVVPWRRKARAHEGGDPKHDGPNRRNMHCIACHATYSSGAETVTAGENRAVAMRGEVRIRNETLSEKVFPRIEKSAFVGAPSFRSVRSEGEERGRRTASAAPA